MKNKLKLLTLALLFHATSSMATPMDYTFEVDFTVNVGDVALTSATVFVTLDGVTNLGVEQFNPAGSYDGIVSAFDVTFGPDTFSMLDAEGYPILPRLTLTDGSLTALFIATDPTLRTKMTIQLDSSSNVVVYGNDTGGSRGSVDAASWAGAPISDVPAPATLALFGLGLAGLGWSRRKKA